MRLLRELHTSTDADAEALRLARERLPRGEEQVRPFAPHGISVVRWGEDGWVIVHSWPERGLLTLDGWLR